MSKRARGIVLWVLSGFFAAALVGFPAFAQQPIVDKLVLADTIQPVRRESWSARLRRPTPMALRRCWWS